MRDQAWKGRLEDLAHDGWRLCARLDRGRSEIESLLRQQLPPGIYDQARYLVSCRTRKVDPDSVELITQENLETAVHDHLFRSLSLGSVPRPRARRSPMGLRFAEIAQ